MSNSKRVLWEIVPKFFGTLGWSVRVKRPEYDEWHTEFYHLNKDVAVEYAVASCKFWLKSMKEKSELRIKNRWGRIQDSRTYGDDPVGTKG